MISFKVMTAEDYDGVNKLWQNTPEMGINSTDDSREGVEKYLKRNPDTSFVAVDDGKIVGAVLAGHDGRRGFIHHMTVLTEYRKQKIATKLLKYTMNAFEKEGIHKVALLTFKKNTAANAFWEKCGFTVRDDVNYRNKCIHELEYRPNSFGNDEQYSQKLT